MIIEKTVTFLKMMFDRVLVDLIVNATDVSA